MWAAANAGSATSRRRRHEDKRRRIDAGVGDGGIGHADDATPNNEVIGSDPDSDSSTDGERSTTESVHEEPSGDNDREPSSSPPSAPGSNASQPAMAAFVAAAASQHKKRKRKRKKKKKKKVIREETPEATMARLKSSYSAAMAAVGALHRVSQQYCVVWKEEGKTDNRGNVGGEESEANSSQIPQGNGVDGENAAMEKVADAAVGREETDAENNESNPPEAAQNENEESNVENTTTKEKLQEVHSTIQRVAQAARTAMEQSLLLDHIILAPILLPDKKKKQGKKPNNNKEDECVDDSSEGMSSAWLDAWNRSSRSATDCEVFLTKWSRLSAAHRTVIKQISYLALVNYADLLLCGCTCYRSKHAAGGQKGGILDRGAVSNLDVLELFSTLDTPGSGQQTAHGINIDGIGNTNAPPDQNNAINFHSSSCLWSNESTERTIRLALAAYCDASELDSTDPTLWFKLACAARALGWEMDCSSPLASSRTYTRGPPRSYRCLERLALERGMSSLPQGVPPNRLLMRAWREMENWDRRPTVYDNPKDKGGEARTDTVSEDKCPVELVLHLPRYSWVTLGRILIRACREGASYGRSLPGGALHHVWSTNCLSSEDYEFGSPLVDVRISPLMATPPTVIGIICEYLEESTDIKRLTCTCRAMPSELASARAKITEVKKRSSMASESRKAVAPHDNSTAKGIVKEDVIEGTGTDVIVDCDTEKTPASKSGDNQIEEDLISPRRGRISKRVRSQMISSGKQTERKSKRSSVEYCLLAGTLSCTAQNPHYTKLLKSDINWEHLTTIKECMQKLPTLSRDFIERPIGSFRKNKNMEASCEVDQAHTFLAPTSLNAFVAKWSRHNSGPRHFLEMFLLHVSLNTGDVFETEVVDLLSSCAIDCFDTLAERHTPLTPWYGPETFENDGNLELALQALAINLLNAELRFKRCESHDIGSHAYQEDSDVLAFIVPNLLQFVSSMSQLEVSNESEPTFFPLQCRVYWLTSSYYLWIGRCSNDAFISKDAEEFGLGCLKETIMFFSKCPQNEGVLIKTPHLVSIGRRGDHWSAISAEALSKYRDHLQSSSIVSRTRQRFQEIQSGVQGRPRLEDEETADIISADDKAKLASLGSELLERYNVNGYGDRSSDVLEELLNDFLMLHEDHLQAPDANTHSFPEHLFNWTRELHWGRIWTDIPSSEAASMINVSREGSRPSIIQVLASSLIASDESRWSSSLFLIFSKMVLTSLLSRAQIFRTDFEERQLKGIDEEMDTTKTCHVRRDQVMLLVVNFFIDKMADTIVSNNDAETHHVIEAFLVGEEFRSIIFSSLNRSSPQKDTINSSTLQLHLFRSFSRLLLVLREYPGLSMQSREKLESVYFVTLVKAMILQKKEFADLITSANDKRLKKWQAHIYTKAELIFSTANEIAELLSLNPSSVNAADGSVNISHLMKAITDLDGDGSHSLQSSPLAQLSEMLIWFWKFLNNTFDTSSPTENVVRNRLMTPISSIIIALCGSPGVSIGYDSSDNFTLSFSDYFDSEDSVNGLFRPCGAAENKDQNKRILLRQLVQLVQCVSLVFQSVSEKHMCQESSSTPFPSSRHGHFLPLVSVRVLSAMSDAIFQLFGESIWGEAYPYGARDCGNTIDNILGKAYLHLYGFSFSSPEVTTENHAPESVKAATQLFRCIKRVYHDNRRSPPRKAFGTVELALPPAKESQVSKAVRAFLFNAEKKAEGANSSTDIPEGVFSEEAENVNLSGQEDQDNIERLRRGIFTELAKGPITNLDSGKKSPSDMDDQGLSEERESTRRHELSLDQKFKAVLECLCYDPRNIENWIVLSECCGFKAEYICDRLVPIQESYDSSHFCLKPESKRGSPATMTLDELQKSQYEEFQASRCNWTPYIGNNLYIYMKYSWSTFSSLQACAKDIGSTFAQDQENTEGPNIDGQNSDYLCWKEIESKFHEGNYVHWANSWAGLFIMALRTMRERALLVARYLAKKSQKGMHPSEVSEDIGTVLYGDLMASTVYGYPMQVMTLYEKRKIAERSLAALQEAIQLSTSSDYTQKSQTICWEIQFMTGKCYEKIASTLREEMYSSNCKEDACPARSYETIMTSAIRNYSEAFVGAQKAEQSSGGPDKSCIGGSSHGALECLYRLHASRFKVLISAIRRVREECELAELEAFRITSVAWFDESNQSSSDGVRGKTWDIFADCVDSLSHCRRVISLFHRAAYRLAQAYSWAPAFHNPDCDLTLGSKQAVPATKSYRIRGLDTGSCAESAAVVMTTLFEKRRTQLCAVWVTTSARPPPFEVLNDSLRKYDALRLKYIRAYIDCMRVCERRDKIETLLVCTATSNQDLPGFYEASASLRGGDPGKHAKQSLLRGSGRSFMTKVKLNAISAIAEMILKELADLKNNGVDNEGKMKLTHHFKLSYKLFRRLNSPCKEVVEFTRSNKPLVEVEAFCKCYLSIQAGYRISSINFDGMDVDTLCSILEGAVSKAKDLSKEERNKNG